MSGKHSFDYILIIMKNLNLIIVLYISGIMAFSLTGYIRDGSAVEFMLAAQGIPSAPLEDPGDGGRTLLRMPDHYVHTDGEGVRYFPEDFR